MEGRCVSPAREAQRPTDPFGNTHYMLTNVEINPLAPDSRATVDQPTIADPLSIEVVAPLSVYRARLNRWAIARITEAGVHIVDRFRSHSDAEGHLHILRRQFPADTFTILAQKPGQENVLP